MMTDDFSYSGTELELFANAHNWKKYLSDSIKPYLGNSVLDVGAGIGATAEMLAYRTFDRYVAVEPDEQLYLENYKKTKYLENKYPYTLLHGLSSDPRIEGYFDTVLYVDVLEHIEHDKDELSFIKNKLSPRGRLLLFRQVIISYFRILAHRLATSAATTKQWSNRLSRKECKYRTWYTLTPLGCSQAALTNTS